jgi:hypothetical protein
MTRAKNRDLVNKLGNESGVGHFTVADIQHWLEERAASLRSSQ